MCLVTDVSFVHDAFRQDDSGRPTAPHVGMEGLQDFYSDVFIMYSMKVRPRFGQDMTLVHFHHSMTWCSQRLPYSLVHPGLTPGVCTLKDFLTRECCS